MIPIRKISNRRTIEIDHEWVNYPRSWSQGAKIRNNDDIGNSNLFMKF